MPKTRIQKETTVQTLIDKLAKAKSVVFADYTKLTMSELSDLRTKLRESGAEFSVTKNNLLKLALGDKRSTINDQQVFEGPIATLFAYEDQIIPIKTLVKVLKDTGKGEVKAGLFDGEVMDKYQVMKLSNLPTKEELQAKIVGSLASPLYGIVGVLNANVRNLVYALDQIRIQKGGE